MKLLGCIADDFTGASDVSSMLVKGGLKTYLTFGTDNIKKEELVEAQAIVIGLKCRSVDSDMANQVVLRALEHLMEIGCDTFFWKYCSTFDSTDKGNIATVTRALLEHLKQDYTIYCPAFPENGRTVYNGHLFVFDKLLHESSMKDHPLTPMKDSNVMRLIKNQIDEDVGLVSFSDIKKGRDFILHKIQDFEKEDIKHIVVDTITNDNMDMLADTFQHLQLFTGGSAIAKSLGNHFEQKKFIQEEFPTAKAQNTIILSGSCSSMSLQQLKHAKEHNIPSFFINPLHIDDISNESIVDWVEENSDKNALLIYTSQESNEIKEYQKNISQMLEDKLGTLASLLYNKNYRNFIIAGGETSGTVVKHLGITSLEVGKSIEPGVPICYDAFHEIFIILKSGNFGQEDFYLKSLREGFHG